MSPEIPPTSFDLQLEAGSVRAITKATGSTSTDMLMVRPSDIEVIPGFNLRITGTKRYQARVELIADSIEAEGFYRNEPLTVFVGKAGDGGNKYYLIGGHTRLAALTLLMDQGRSPPEYVPVLVKPNNSSMADLAVSVFKTGEGLTPYELAIGVKRLEGLGLDEAEIVRRTGLTKRYIDDLRLLIAVPVKVRNLLLTDKVSGTLVIQEIREKGVAQGSAAIVEAAAAVKASNGEEARVTRAAVERTTATREAETGKSDKPGSFKYVFKAKIDDVVELDHIGPFINLFDGDWFSADGLPEGQVKIIRPIRVRLSGFRGPGEPDAHGL